VLRSWPRVPQPRWLVLLAMGAPWWGCTEYGSLTIQPNSPGALVDATLEGDVTAMAEGPDQRWIATGDSFLVDGFPEGRGTLPIGPITALGRLTGVSLAYVHGIGLFRKKDGNAWEPTTSPSAPVLSLVGESTSVTPIRMRGVDDTVAYLAGVGGLFRTADAGSTWNLLHTETSGNTNVVFTDVAIGQDPLLLLATATEPTAMLPADLASLFQGTVFQSSDGGESWVSLTEGLPSRYATAAALDHAGTPWVGTMDRGLYRHDKKGWHAVAGGPTDVVSLAPTEYGIAVGTATRGVWHWAHGIWTQTGTRPVRDTLSTTAATVNGSLYRYGPGAQSPEATETGTVHIALSFHVNYYHSYRGDSPTEDGFGRDIRVITSVLDWLDERSHVRADWDADNAFTTDAWMATESPDVLERIAARVRAGTDQVRLMSWNNGAMTASTREEFDRSIELAKASNEAAFGSWVPGVQPQESMFGPDHIRAYTDAGIEFVTLFNAANGFTALREELTLRGNQAHQPFLVVDPLSEAEMTALPTYHHGDVLEHGGLLGWVEQLSANHPDDSLLAIHFDADAESWERFYEEIDALDGHPSVVWTTMYDYLRDHPPSERHFIEGDVADGTGDGLQSWAEKDINHDIYTQIAAARELADSATMLDHDGRHADALRAALDARLLALSTTHFGLAAPTLHPDRALSAAMHAEDAFTQALNVAALAFIDSNPREEVLYAVHPRDSAGPARVRFAIDDVTPGLLLGPVGGDFAPVGFVTGPDGISIAEAIVDVGAHTVSELRVGYDGPEPAGELTLADAPFWRMGLVGVPVAKCGPETASGIPLGEPIATVDVNGAWAAVTQLYTLELCGFASSVQHTYRTHQGLPGTLLTVSATLGGEPPLEGLTSLMLSPISCPGPVTSLTWRTVQGVERTRVPRDRIGSWNGQTIDGYASAECDGRTVQFAHLVRERSSIGMLPMGFDGWNSILAPLGTLYGPPPWHDARQTGGTGLGDIVVGLVGSQFRPSAPDWAGQSVRYELLLGDGELSSDELDLFAHPPILGAL
jgi:hypothetical protein